MQDPEFITTKPPRKQKLHRRRSTFGEVDELATATDKAAMYGNLVLTYTTYPF